VEDFSTASGFVIRFLRILHHNDPCGSRNIHKSAFGGFFLKNATQYQIIGRLILMRKIEFLI